MLTGHTADQLSHSVHVYTLTTVLAFCLVGFENKGIGCEIVYMQYGWQGDQDAGLSWGAKLLENRDNPYVL